MENKITSTQILLFVQIFSSVASFTCDAQSGQMSKMWFNMESAQGAFSQTLLGYSSLTTNGLDYGYDGTLLNDGVIALYTKVGDTKLVIQARGEFNAADIVPLHYRANVPGQYTIKLHNKTGVFANGQSVYLRDKQTENVHDFSTGVYTFTATQGTTEDRFDIIYTLTGTNTPLGNSKQQLNGKNMLVYSKNESLIVATPGRQISEVRIFDTRGRLLHEAKNVGSESIAINIAAKQQMLIVQVSTPEGVKASKKVIY